MKHEDGNIYLWDNFSQHPEQVQEEMLKEFELLLPHLTIKEQSRYFQGAPVEVILKFYGSLAWQAQVVIWNNYLPVGMQEQARPLLSHEAEVALKLYKHYCL